MKKAQPMPPHVLRAWNKHWVDSPGFNTPAKPCSRCDAIAENSPPGVAYINGHTIEDFVLCRDCRELLVNDKRTFYDQGWPRYHPK